MSEENINPAGAAAENSAQETAGAEATVQNTTSASAADGEKIDLAATLAALSGELASLREQLADLRALKDAQGEKIGTLSAELKAAKDEAAESAVARDKAREQVKSLKAAAKSAEKIAAEKYGTGIPSPVAASPAGDPAALRERLNAAYGNARAMREAVRSVTKEQLNNALLFSRG